MAVEHPDAHLLIAGRVDDQMYFAQTQAYARSLPSADRIHLRGHSTNPTALLAAADAFVLDSFCEGWVLSSMEAFGAGTPCVLSDVGGAREQLGEDNARGYLASNPCGSAEMVDWERMSQLRFRPQPNHDDFVAGMSAVVRDRDRWASRRAELSADAVTRFSPEICLAEHARLLRSVATR